MTTQTIEKPKEVPANALQLNVGRTKFVAGEKGANTAPVSLVARTGQPISHWYWGRIVHDLSGFFINGSDDKRVTIDYCHNDHEILGYLDKFNPSDKQLDTSGELVWKNEDDRAYEVSIKGDAGVPYEASIDFGGDGTVIEELDVGASAEVNGYTFEGPGVIVRKWPLRGVAICPHGYDQGTGSQFTRDGDGPEQTVSVTTLTRKETEMSKDDKPADTPTDKPAETELTNTDPAPTPNPDKPATSRDQFTQELERYTTTFGADNGTKWFSAGMEFEAALQEHCKLQAVEIAELRKERDELKTKFASLSAGDPDATDTPPPGETKKGIGQFVRISGKDKE